MSQAEGVRPWSRTGLLSIGHLLNDGFGGFFAPLLPLLIERLDLSLTLAGVLGTIRIVTNSALQPSLGHLIDRSHRPALVVLGPILTVAAMSLLGRAASFAQLLVIMLVAGIGTALFHPAAAAMVTAGSPPRQGLLMALFSSGGTLGAALAPMAIIGFAGAYSIDRSAWLALPGFLILAGFALPLRRLVPASRAASCSTGERSVLPPRFAVLWLVTVLASTCSAAFSGFLAVLVVERGGTAWTAGAALSLFLIAGAATEFVAGNLSDRIGRKVVIFVSLALATPLLLALVRGPAWSLLPAAALAGAATLASSPVGVVAAQECVPGRTGLVSGLIMGLAWGVGGIALTPIGWLADRLGLVSVMSVVAFLPALGAGTILFFREPARGAARRELRSP
jgi:FSR family fosmidomycin resistance protein-like MFS transporter